MRAEGWYRDPFESHDDRWFSDGRPTALVRDGGLDSYDAPPAQDWSGPLAPVASVEPANGDDLKRADQSVPEGDALATSKLWWAT
ncbi:hypothetical protein ACPPVO_21225 [Dactylosporangium sp. McL0621]|uniref:hypothetical protein n=1 Tax=Dactylosporangium sp. McL0621 TaxID=3415678 RepID=UPI003CEE1DCF